MLACDDFEEFYKQFEHEITRIIHMFYAVQDIFSTESAQARPAYLLSSMLADCQERGRNMHDGGVRYHNYGSAPIGIANAADAMYAIKKAIYDEKITTKEALLKALETDYAGAEYLRLQLQHIPKYGQQHTEADAMALRVTHTVCNAYSSYKNRFGGAALPIILTFTFGVEASKMLGATADGGHRGKMVAQGLTPQSCSMTKGITAAIGSNLSIPTILFAGGASTMWDFDESWASNELLRVILVTFLKGGGQIFQGNTTSVQDLIQAQRNPENYEHLIVRVGGFSARFTFLEKSLQDEIIARHRHVS